MVTITFDGKSYPGGNESVLESLTKAGLFIPHSCKSGLCQACEMRLMEGQIPNQGYKGLTDNKIQANHFLACQCIPTQDISIATLDGEVKNISTTLIHRIQVSQSIFKLVLEPKKTLSYCAGQYLRVYHSKNDFRCYSIASNPDLEETIELHIQVIPSGKVSNWLVKEVKIGEQIEVSEAMGSCIYPNNNMSPTLFIASNSGLAPIYGMLKKALYQGDKQVFHLVHGVTSEKDKYLTEELRELKNAYPNLKITWFDYSLVETNKQKVFIDTALSQINSPQDWKVYFCGHPDMVAYGKKQSFLKGVSMKNLYSDAFVPSKVN
ncbi:MAG: 2Fe-2S iron-sulfur cluster binding domain-containing protein [Betaproteobacteria bacterium]|nr:2Fe-2S iron-sulfur cluster binding domain-containing protein [Betaproteobacteria bacterium]MDE2423906.1 2Fe-2S iron-sulfur cluster binding domain-containing protein [Betaproteobacteria bacterium]